MKGIDKSFLLDRLEQRVGAHLEDAISVYQNMHTDLLLRPAANGGWSVAQCLEHLNRYGAYYLPAIRKALNRGGVKSEGGVFRGGVLGAYFTKMMDPDTGKKKYPAMAGYIPDLELDAHAVVAEFIRQQEELLACIQWARKADLHVRVPISIARWIRLKLGDVLQFMVAHDERHLRQAARMIVVSETPGVLLCAN